MRVICTFVEYIVKGAKFWNEKYPLKQQQCNRRSIYIFSQIEPMKLRGEKNSSLPDRIIICWPMVLKHVLVDMDFLISIVCMNELSTAAWCQNEKCTTIQGENIIYTYILPTVTKKRLGRMALATSIILFHHWTTMKHLDDCRKHFKVERCYNTSWYRQNLGESAQKCKKCIQVLINVLLQASYYKRRYLYHFVSFSDIHHDVKIHVPVLVFSIRFSVSVLQKFYLYPLMWYFIFCITFARNSASPFHKNLYWRDPFIKHLAPHWVIHHSVHNKNETKLFINSNATSNRLTQSVSGQPTCT